MPLERTSGRSVGVSRFGTSASVDGSGVVVVAVAVEGNVGALMRREEVGVSRIASEMLEIVCAKRR